MSEPRLGDCPHVFVDDLDLPVIGEEDAHHLARVLRVRPGDPVTISDGLGRWRAAVFGEQVEPIGGIETVPDAVPPITVAFALVKGGRPELIVQKLTEIGVERIVAFAAERSVVRWDEAKADHHRRRWERIAREAAMQSRRCRLPRIEGVATTAQVAAIAGIRRCEPGAPVVDDVVAAVAVGPEGGFSDAERAVLSGSPVGLGPHVLRAETAAIVAGALAVARREAVQQ